MESQLKTLENDYVNAMIDCKIDVANEVKEKIVSLGGKVLTTRQLNNKVKMVMVTTEFGKPMYVKQAVSICARPTLTEDKNEAIVWGLFDGSKLGYNAALVGAKELVFENLQ